MRKLSFFGGLLAGLLSSFVAHAQTIDLNKPEVSADGQTAVLRWSPAIEGNDIFEVFKRETDNPMWQRVVLTTDTVYTDTISFCKEGLYFIKQWRGITLIDSSNEMSVKNLDPKPKQLVLDSISVFQNSGLLFGWHPSEDLTCQGYNIYMLSPTIDTLQNLPNPHDSAFVMPNINNCSEKQRFVVAAYDGCGETQLNEPYQQGPVSIPAIDYDVCSQSVRVSFLGYTTADSLLQSVIAYDLFEIVDGDTSLVQTHASNDDFIVDVDVNKLYRFFIRAHLSSPFSGLVTSSSCILPEGGLNTFPPEIPAFMELERVSVNPDNSVSLDYSFDTMANFRGVELQRSEMNLWSDFDSIYFQDKTGLPGYTDTVAQPRLRPYYYRLVAIDQCGNVADSSKVVSSIHLQIDSNDGLNNLNWSEFIGIPFDGYEIWRAETVGFEKPELLASVSETTWTYEDNVQNPGILTGQFCYRVAAYWVKQNDTLRNFSNVVEANQPTMIEMPKAFTPDQTQNRIFMPKGAHLSPEGYHLQVFNRWGALVFESVDPNKGWDGRYKNAEAPQGGYVYVLQFQDNNREYHEQKGSFLLLRGRLKNP